MGALLHVKEVRLDGADREHVWRFPRGVTVIEGSIGGGKTSLLNLINFGLGGDPELTDQVRGAGKGVTLTVAIEDREISLSRSFARRATITAQEGDAPAVDYVNQSGLKRPWISDLLLGALGVPSIRVPKSRARKRGSHELTSISFRDVFAFCYLDQEQVDRSTMHSEDRNRGPKREWTFELLFGLIDKELADLEAQIEDQRQAVQVRGRRIEAVEQFAIEKELPLDREAIERRVREIDDLDEALEAELLVARERAGQAADGAEEARVEASQLAESLARAEQERARIESELEGVQRTANQLKRDIEALNEGIVSRELLSPIDFAVCPRCEQPLGTPAAPETCSVCKQPEPADGDEQARDYLEGLTLQSAETDHIAKGLERERGEVGRRIKTLGSALAAQRQRVREIVAEITAPHLDHAVRIEQQLGGLRAEREVLRQARLMASAVSEERADVASIKPQISDLENRALERRENLKRNASARVEDLSNEFQAILASFTLPWLQTAEVDPSSYLPIVNGNSLRKLSSGGMKATTNAAYYLAVLVSSIRDSQVLSPRFLMLDSIRKDYGAGEKDLARAEQIYNYLRTLEAMRNADALGGDFQLIVVDNDLPPGFGKTFNTIRIDPEQPLIRADP